MQNKPGLATLPTSGCVSPLCAACWWLHENGQFDILTTGDIGFGRGVSTLMKSEFKNYTQVDESPGLPEWPVG
jgi:hypothetical protein